MWVPILKWIKHLHTVTLNIQEKKKKSLGIDLKYKISLTSVTKTSGNTINRCTVFIMTGIQFIVCSVCEASDSVKGVALMYSVYSV